MVQNRNVEYGRPAEEHAPRQCAVSRVNARSRTRREGTGTRASRSAHVERRRSAAREATRCPPIHRGPAVASPVPRKGSLISFPFWASSVHDSVGRLFKRPVWLLAIVHASNRNHSPPTLTVRARNRKDLSEGWRARLRRAPPPGPCGASANHRDGRTAQAPSDLRSSPSGQERAPQAGQALSRSMEAGPSKGSLGGRDLTSVTAVDCRLWPIVRGLQVNSR